MDLPVEILREIFELATLTDNKSAVNLSLTSKWVKQWTYPLMYHTVTLSTPRAVRTFLSSPEAKATASLVRNLGIFTSGPMQSINRIITKCTELQSLACGFSMPSYASISARAPSTSPTTMPHEQHLLGAACRDGWDPSVVSPAVSHLRVALPHEIAVQECVFAHVATLPDLTHFAIVYRISPRRQTTVASLAVHIERLLQTAPSLQILLVQVMGTDSDDDAVQAEIQDWHKLRDEQPGQHFEKVVATKAPRLMSREWEDASKFGSSIWDIAA
jgi:hypothetical protein